MVGINTPISSTLLHFTGKYLNQTREAYLAHLREIITKGIRFNTPDEILVISPDLIWPYLQDIICFTDIPLELCRELSELYGKLGFGFSRETIQSYGGNPVFYVPNGFVTRSKILESLYQILEGHGKALHLLANFKMYGESTDRFCFLKEREWRLIYDEDPELAGTFVTRAEEERDLAKPVLKVLFKNRDFEVTLREEGLIATFNVRDLKTGQDKPFSVTRLGQHRVHYFRFAPMDVEVLVVPRYEGFKEEVQKDPIVKAFFGSQLPPLRYFDEG